MSAKIKPIFLVTTGTLTIPENYLYVTIFNTGPGAATITTSTNGTQTLAAFSGPTFDQVEGNGYESISVDGGGNTLVITGATS